MASVTATLHLQTGSCPVQAALPPGCTLHHVAPGIPGPPYGFIEGKPPAGWIQLASTPRGALLERSDLDCSNCILADLPGGTRPLRASVSRDGIVVDLISPTTEALHGAIDFLRASAVVVRVARTGIRPSLELSSGAFVDLGSLTGRQLEILQTAVRMGYFDVAREASILELAKRVGCSGPTAHEHLRKALDKVMGSLFEQAPKAAASLQAAPMAAPS